MAPTVDLRGKHRSARPKGAVLADPSGRRARVLRHVGRAVAILFVLWLVGLLLGLGLLPGIDGHRHDKNTASEHRVKSGPSARPATAASEPLVTPSSASVDPRSRSSAATPQTGRAGGASRRGNRSTGSSRTGHGRSASAGKSATTRVTQTANRGKALARGKVHKKHLPKGWVSNTTATDGNGPLS